MKTSVILVSCLASLVLPAADDLSVAREALRDGLWEVARTHARAAIGSTDAKLVVLESLAGEGKWDEVGKTLAQWPLAKGAAFDYYRAVTRGDHKAAMDVLKQVGSDAGVVEAQLYEAEVLAKAGRRDDAVVLWKNVAARTNLSDRVTALVSSNLMDPDLLAKAYSSVRTVALRRGVGLRLGTAWMKDSATAAEGERLVRALVKDAPDTKGAMEAFLAIADVKIVAGDWKEAVEAYREAVEMWPDAAKLASVQENRGWALQKLGRPDEALEAFRTAGALAQDDDSRALALLKEGDVLSEVGRVDEAMATYRQVLEKYPKTAVAEKLKTVVRLRELEAEGRRLYGAARYDEAMKVFVRVASEDSARRQRMAYFEMLCLYGQGFDERAEQKARELVEKCPDAVVRADALLWLAKYLYNRREWKESGALFVTCSESSVPPETAAESLLWASRAALSENDFKRAIQLSTRLLERYPDAKSKPRALLVQGEALVELARFDEAVLVFERVTVADDVLPKERLRAQILKADAFYVMGADNSVRYAAALEAYQSVLISEALSPSGRLTVSFKIARTLEKLKRMDEAIEQYYAHVVLAYRDGRRQGERFNEEARAAFSRAAFRLAEEYESRGRDYQALRVLDLVAESDVPAAEAARRRIGRIQGEGGFL